MKIDIKALALGLVAVNSCTLGADADKKAPNILIAISDDQSYPYAGAYGCDWVKTPAFDRVANEGLLFSNCYTPNSKSAPSRACLLTGRYSWQLEEAANHIGYWPDGGKYPTIFEVLKENGYSTAFTGKGWAPGNPGTIDDRPRRLTGEPFQSCKLVPPTPCITDTDYAENFKEFLASKPEGKPWAFWCGSREPHRPYEYGSGRSKGGKDTGEVDYVPSYWPDDEVVRTDMLDYAFEIEHFDSHVQRILDLLEQTGELDNTIVIYTADNGMPFPRRKGFTYEHSVHLPLAIMWPKGIKKPNRKIDQYVSLVDIAPTLLKLAGLGSREGGMDPSGTEMTDIFAGKTRHKRNYILFGQERHDYGRPNNQGYPARSILCEGYLYINNLKPELWPSCNPETGYLNTDGSPVKTEILNLRRNGTDTLMWHLAFGKRAPEELYHIDEDPECLDNLADDPSLQKFKNRLHKILFSTLERQRDPRVTGNGDIFDSYPFNEQVDYFFYERYMAGEADSLQTLTWVNGSDFEPKRID